MQSFWEMSDSDKLKLVGEIFLIAFGWASLIIAAIAVMVLTVEWVRHYLPDWEQERLKKRQMRVYCPDPDPQMGIFQLQQARRERQIEREEFFRNVQEIQNDLR